MLFEHYLALFSLLALVATVIYGGWADRQDAAKRARKMALGEAAAALQSLADVAGDAAASRQRAGLSNKASADRAYHMQRAASIVASIPVDRL
jgi:hypothetical protein